MSDEIKDINQTELITTQNNDSSLELASIDTTKLSDEAKTLITQIIAEKDEQKTHELTQLFNANQNKKTMIRVNKLSDLLDTITDQALTRFTSRPDEISNKELFDGLKIVQDLIERGQKQVTCVSETPLIQVNQQNNEVNFGNTTNTLSRDSRERVKSAVLSILNNITTEPVENNNTEIIDIEAEENSEEN